MVCGPGKLGNRLVPDEPLGAADFTLCCAYHDYGYDRPEKRSRKEVDLQFRRCMLKAAKQGKHPGLGAIMARIYFGVVRMGGWFSWQKAAKRQSHCRR